MFTENKSIDDRKVPTETPCSHCGGEVFQSLANTKLSMVSDYKTPLRRAGSEWGDVLKKVKSGSGRVNTIHD